MQIETKFNVGDKLWFVDGKGQILEVIINSIDIKVNGKMVNHNFNTIAVVEYRIRPTSESSYTFNCIKENRLYKTKQEAGEAWLKSQGLKCGVSDD